MARSYEGIPRKWAAWNEGKAGPRARDRGEGKRVSFCGRVFYSYQTPVATYAANARGELCVLMLDEKFSVSTGQHKQSARWSASVPIFEVDKLGVGGGWARWDDLEGYALHKHNAEDLLAKANDIFDDYRKRWRRADDSWGAKWMCDRVSQAYVNVVEYCTFWDVPIPEGNIAAADAVSRLREGWAAQKARFDDPKAVLKRERARGRALAKKALMLEDDE